MPRPSSEQQCRGPPGGEPAAAARMHSGSARVTDEQPRHITQEQPAGAVRDRQRQIVNEIVTAALLHRLYGLLWTTKALPGPSRIGSCWSASAGRNAVTPSIRPP